MNRRRNPNQQDLKDRFWLWMASITILVLAVSAFLVILDERDAAAERNRMHEHFMQRCEKNYPVYRCNIMWDSFTQENK